MPNSHVYYEQVYTRAPKQKFTDAALKSALNGADGWKTAAN